MLHLHVFCNSTETLIRAALLTHVAHVVVVNKVTPRSRVLPEKLKRPKLFNKFPAFYGTQRFITAFTRARHLSLS
jgi:tRNA(Glu) U13 pseudouridine synthase TruD